MIPPCGRSPGSRTYCSECSSRWSSPSRRLASWAAAAWSTGHSSGTGSSSAWDPRRAFPAGCDLLIANMTLFFTENVFKTYLQRCTTRPLARGPAPRPRTSRNTSTSSTCRSRCFPQYWPQTVDQICLHYCNCLLPSQCRWRRERQHQKLRHTKSLNLVRLGMLLMIGECLERLSKSAKTRRRVPPWEPMVLCNRE